MTSTDRAWEEWGRRDPYFGIITDPKFRLKDMTEAARQEFFESGRAHVDHVFDTIRRHIAPDFRPRSILELGCGVGRLLIPFAAHAEKVVGLDVSQSMLEEARRNCDGAGLANVRLALSDDVSESLAGTFDLIHSFIVFQHIPAERGRAIFSRLLVHLAPGGIGAVHFSYSKSHYQETHGVAPPAKPQGGAPAPQAAPKRSADPEMQMNPYNANEILFAMQRSGVGRFHAEFTDHGGELGIFLFFARP